MLEERTVGISMNAEDLVDMEPEDEVVLARALITALVQPMLQGKMKGAGEISVDWERSKTFIGKHIYADGKCANSLEESTKTAEGLMAYFVQAINKTSPNALRVGGDHEPH